MDFLLGNAYYRLCGLGLQNALIYVWLLLTSINILSLSGAPGAGHAGGEDGWQAVPSRPARGTFEKVSQLCYDFFLQNFLGPS